MVTEVLHCPHCHGIDIVRPGTIRQGKQRDRCRACPERGRTFLLEYIYPGHSPAVKQQIVDMALYASGIRDTARVLHMSPTWAATGCRLCVAANPAGAVWDHAVLHGWMGSVRAAHCPRATRHGQAAHTKDREPAYQSTDSDHAACPPHSMFVHNDDHLLTGPAHQERPPSPW